MATRQAGSEIPDGPEGGTARFLGSLPLFRNVSGDDLSVLAAYCTEADFPAGASVFREGDAGNFLYIVREGLVKLVARSQKGAETILLLLGPGELFGDLIFSEARRIFSASAVTAVRGIAIPKDGFQRLLAPLPAVGLNFIHMISERLARMGKGVAESRHSWSDRRLAAALLHLAEIYGREVPEGTLLDLPLTHRDLANLIGATRETVTIHLNRFYRRGLASRRGRRLVARCPALEEFLLSGGAEDPAAIDESA